MNKKRKNLAWTLNWIRQSELEGALLMGKVIGSVNDPFLIRKITEHCHDEARHAQLWTETIDELNLPMIRIHKSVQSFYIEEAEIPRTLVDTLALTHVFEKRVHNEFKREADRPDLPEAAKRTYRQLLEEEQDHLRWVSRWLDEQDDAEAVLERYETVDRNVFEKIEPYRDRIWELSDLGTNVSSNSNSIS